MMVIVYALRLLRIGRTLARARYHATGEIYTEIEGDGERAR